jgi:hypothetical protein
VDLVRYLALSQRAAGVDIPEGIFEYSAIWLKYEHRARQVI